VPATVLTRAEIERSGHTNLADLLRELPEFPVAYINDAVAINTTRGSVAPDLRGLGAGNTLVLVNGRRTTVSANAWDTTVFVDANRFPPSLLERVEVLKGGASAVYGADAVAGVVNLITRRLPAGGEWRVSYGNTFSTDVAELDAAFAAGVTRGRLGLTVSGSFTERHALASRDRSFSRTANLAPRFAAAYAEFARLPADQLAAYDGRSLSAPNARFTLVGGQVNGQNGVSLPGLAAGTAITALPGTGGTAAGTLSQATPSYGTPFRDATGGQFNAAAAATFVAPELTRTDPAARNLYNANEETWLVPAARRAGLHARLDYALSASVALFVELGAQRNHSRTQIAPLTVSGTVPRTNPYNPFGVDVNTVWRLVDAGPRRSHFVNDAQSLTFGARSEGHPAITWDTAASYSRDDFKDANNNLMSAPRVRAALASTQAATALNPFGGATYRQNPALIESLKIQTWFSGWADLASFDAKLARPLFTTRAGQTTAAAYVEGRREQFHSFSDAPSQAGEALGWVVPGDDARFTRNAVAFAGEIIAPVLAAARGETTPRLTVEGAARSEIFSGSFRSGWRPSVGAVAHPAPGLRVRASHAWTFRAPTLLQLYAPQSEGYANSLPDPRRPVALTGDLSDGPNVSRLIREGGNPGLQPEKGRVLQIGATWEMRALPGFALEAGWFRYKMENLIAGIGRYYALQNELSGLGYLVHREPGTETYVNRTGAPIPLLSGPNGQTTDLAPGQSATVPGRLVRVDSFLVNLSRRQLIGWDFGARQTIDAGARGRWTVNAAATCTVESSSAFDRFSPLIDNAGGQGTPLWRGRATLDWERRAWSAGTTLIYTASSGSHADRNYMKPYRTVSLRASWSAPPNSWLRGARSPPASTTCSTSPCPS
jgi:outer membrane receptor protein involved in Fe transport